MCVSAYRDQGKHSDGLDSQAYPQGPVSKAEIIWGFDRGG